MQNAQGSSSTMQTQADAAITNGASVLVVDALDSGSGAAIEQDAKSKGVATIDYDRPSLGPAVWPVCGPSPSSPAGQST